jgi:hypothetical protein
LAIGCNVDMDQLLCGVCPECRSWLQQALVGSPPNSVSDFR